MHGYGLFSSTLTRHLLTHFVEDHAKSIQAQPSISRKEYYLLDSQIKYIPIFIVNTATKVFRVEYLSSYAYIRQTVETINANYFAQNLHANQIDDSHIRTHVTPYIDTVKQ